MSAVCSAGVLRSCPVQWRSEPLASRLMTCPPHPAIQSTLRPPSTKPSTSIRPMQPAPAAQAQMPLTLSCSPSLTRAEPTSTRSAWRSSISRRVMDSFSWGRNDTPGVCSPSRRVVSIISTRRLVTFSVLIPIVSFLVVLLNLSFYLFSTYLILLFETRLFPV